MKSFIYIAALLISLVGLHGVAGEPQQMQLDEQVRKFYRNPDGSCVQCSIGMCGCHCNQIQAATLLWETDYGKAERKGSWPSRVEQYMNSRNIAGWNITGDNTYEWMKWACATRRFAAIACGSSHFQTLYGYDPEKNTWQVCNNNSPTVIDNYSDAEFHRLHERGGHWIVVLENSSPENPQIVEWWK